MKMPITDLFGILRYTMRLVARRASVASVSD
jgi:hypothetical protein